MMCVYTLLDLQPLSRIVRLAKPLRVERKVQALVKFPAVSRPLSVAGNHLLSLFDSGSENSTRYTVALHQDTCGQDFTALAEKVGGRYGVCIQRSAEYLNWRYLAHPLYRYELLTARLDGVLLAYAVFSHTDENATLVDLFGIEDPRLINGLVDTLVALLRKRGVVTVSAPMLESHPWILLMQRMGFRKRESTPVVIYAPSRRLSKGSGIEGLNWFLMHGDRDS